jgi:hydroxyacylglutathione hydrolase
MTVGTVILRLVTPDHYLYAGSLRPVLVRRIVAQAFETNCFVVAPAAGEECVIIDPGVGVEDAVDAVLREEKLKPTAVLLSHGHLDHVFAVVPVCGAKGIPALIHPYDREQMANPAKAFGMPPGTPVFGRLDFGEPEDVRMLEDGETLQLAGMELAVDHTPGHTPGSVIFRSEDRLFSGDLLFRGSVGRTDLPGGSYEQLLASLARSVLPLSDDTLVHCGHLDDTTVGRERATNPFLAEITPGPVTRGL